MDISPEEIAVAALAPDIRRCIRLLEGLDGLQGYSAPSWSERVEGGSPVAAAERRVELKEALATMPPKTVLLAEKLRGWPPSSQRGRYIENLLLGHTGQDLMELARLRKKPFTECRGWLKATVETINFMRRVE